MTVLDDIDRRILRVLSQDGRISNVDLAGKVGLSPSACLRRVQELERRDIIQGYRAQLNAAALGIGFLAYVTVGLSRHTKQEQADFEAAIKRQRMSGGRDPTCPQISAACSIRYDVFPGEVQLRHGSVELKFHGSVQNRTMAGLQEAAAYAMQSLGLKHWPLPRRVSQ